MESIDARSAASAASSPPTPIDGEGDTMGGGTPPAPVSRYIFTPPDMEQFRRSPARAELLGFATALGRSCASPETRASGYRYRTSDPLEGLSPATASLHGSLRQMAERWTEEVPPDGGARARFGNPEFRTWHARLTGRSEAIVRAALDCHRAHGLRGQGGGERSVGGAGADTTGAAEVEATGKEGGDAGGRRFDPETLRLCSEAGYAAAASGETPPPPLASREADVVAELRAYLHLSFGHPVRLDYGTGHESAFLVFLLALGKLGCLWGDSGKGGARGGLPPPASLAPVALSVFSQYLAVTRGLQRNNKSGGYMLEPAGSHGVWGLDDYHCLPFYFGACQLQDPDVSGDIGPRSIDDDRLLRARGDELMYLGCIRYVKELKPSVPFFESSPMLNDISHLPNWGRVARGLLRLYEGEVLDKMPVVQHFRFGNLFKGELQF